jgi:hypothetical protein
LCRAATEPVHNGKSVVPLLNNVWWHDYRDLASPTPIPRSNVAMPAGHWSLATWDVPALLFFGRMNNFRVRMTWVDDPVFRFVA